MSHTLLIALLILVGPFLAVSPGAIATLVQLAPARRGHRRPAVSAAVRRRPLLAAAGWAVA